MKYLHLAKKIIKLFAIIIPSVIIYMFISVAIGLGLGLEKPLKEGMFVLFRGIGILIIILVIFLTFLYPPIAYWRNSRYEKKNTVMLEDPKHGTHAFVKDKSGHYKALDYMIPFGGYLPTICFKDYQEINKELYFRGLDYVCKMPYQILNTFYLFIKESCDTQGEKDEKGYPLSVQRIKEEFELSSIQVSVGVSGNYGTYVTLCGCLGLDHNGEMRLGGHELSLTVDCKTDVYSYDLIKK